MNIPWENQEWVARLEKATAAYQEKFGRQPHLIFLLDEKLPERFETAVQTGKEIPDEELP